MDIERRDFVKGCAASSVLLLVGMDNAAKAVTAHQVPVSVDNIEKSIKASFGGSFSLQGHAHSHGLARNWNLGKFREFHRLACPLNCSSEMDPNSTR